MAIMLGIGSPNNRKTRIGRLTTKTDCLPDFNVLDITAKGCATVTGIDEGKEHTFRLITRLGLFELYVDNLLVQTFYYKEGPGRIGFVVNGAKATFRELKAWQM